MKAAVAAGMVLVTPWPGRGRDRLPLGPSPASGIPDAQAAVQDALGGLTFFFLLSTTPWVRGDGGSGEPMITGCGSREVTLGCG